MFRSWQRIPTLGRNPLEIGFAGLMGAVSGVKWNEGFPSF